MLGVTYLALNNDRPLFKGANLALAKAVNYAIDRTAMLRPERATSPASGPTRSCRRASPASATPTSTRSRARTSRCAKKLAKPGITRHGKIVLLHVEPGVGSAAAPRSCSST